MTVVYCYDLVTLKTPNWTRAMDDYLRAEYFPGLSIAQLSRDMQRHFRKRNWVIQERSVANRLSKLGLRRKKVSECL